MVEEVEQAGRPAAGLSAAVIAWWGAAAVALAGGCYAWVDRPVARWVHGMEVVWRRPGSWGSEAGEAGYWLVGLAIIAAALWSRRRALAWRWIEVWAAVAVSGIAVNVLKIMVTRARPSVLFATDKFPGDLWGFFFSQRWDSHFLSCPSGHATTAGAIAAAVWFAKPRWAWAGVIFYLVIAASRVLAEAHYVSDVVVGGYLGVVTMVMVRRVSASRASAENRDEAR